jgi:tripartite ATP-independent transporter DctP family solute receptor
MIDRRRVIAGLAGTAIAATRAASAAPRGADGLMTAADVHIDGYPTVEAVRWISRVIEGQTAGRLRIRVYHSGQLGREGDTVNLARFGALDITRVNVAALNNAFELTDVLALPYVFDSVEHMRHCLDGAIGREILDGFEARGLVGLAFYDSGVRCFYNHLRPIVTPADLRGLKIRVPASDIFVGLVRALGANPTPLSIGEVFSSLQTHLIDGAENNWPTFYTSRQFEVARYWSQSRHSFAPEVLLISKRRLEAMTSADRALIREAAAKSVPFMRGLWDRREAEARAAVEKAGVHVNEVDREAFRGAAAPLVAEYLNKNPDLDRLHRAIRALA